MHPQSKMHSSAGQRDMDASHAHKNSRSCVRRRRVCACMDFQRKGFLERVVVIVAVVVVLYTTCIYSF